MDHIRPSHPAPSPGSLYLSALDLKNETFEKGLFLVQVSKYHLIPLFSSVRLSLYLKRQNSSSMLLFLSIIEKRSESRTKSNLTRSQTDTIVLKTCSKRILFCKSRLDLQKSKLNSHKSSLVCCKSNLAHSDSNPAFYFLTRSGEKINRKSDLFRPLYNNLFCSDIGDILLLLL